MLIGVDMRTVFQASRRGTGKNLLDLYTTIARRRPDWLFVMYHRNRQVDDPFADLANVESRFIDMPGDRWNLWQRVRLPLAARAARVDVLHCPANTGPRHPLRPMVVTIHDLIPLDDRFGGPEAAAWERNVRRAVRKARRIVTPSETTRQMIVNRLGAPSDKVVVNHWAPDRGCQRVTDADRLLRARQRYGLADDRPYVLGFGAADPRKNTRGVLTAWSQMSPSLRQGWQLLLVGISPSAMSDFERLREELGIADSCVLSGFADEEDIPALLSGAEVLCYPSLAEGFGLPILDAMVCETAVLTSNVTSLPEVAGDAALLVDPEDVAAMTGGLAELLSNTARRTELVERGRERVRAFTWDACADRICEVFAAVADERANA
jgi:glycosyltransferase involved in cell wall biosynthesis